MYIHCTYCDTNTYYDVEDIKDYKEDTGGVYLEERKMVVCGCCKHPIILEGGNNDSNNV